MNWFILGVLLGCIGVCGLCYFVGMAAGYQDGADDAYHAGFAAGKAINCKETAQ